MELLIDNVGKLYKGNVWGLRNFSLMLKPRVLALLGPNGSGKSILMRILATITKSTEGIVIWDSEDIKRPPDYVRAVLGYLSPDFGIYPNLIIFDFMGLGKACVQQGNQLIFMVLTLLFPVVNIVGRRIQIQRY